MNVAQIYEADCANGPGTRLSLFVSGCTNHCPGCFNPETWEFNYGVTYTEEMENQILEELAKPYYRGLSILGGEPMEIVNQEALVNLIRKVRAMSEPRDIWIYTGFHFEDLFPGGKRHCDVTDEILWNIDVLVDGPFVEKQKNLRLPFRGSENQRIIDVRKSMEAGKVILKEGYDNEN